MKHFTFVLLSVFALSFPSVTMAQVTVSRWVVGNGGAAISNSNFRLVGTVGQPLIGSTVSSVHFNQVGFWYLAGSFVTGVEQKTNALPTVFRLEQNYPNPFNPSTTIQFALPKPSAVTLKLFDVLGQEVETLLQGKLPAGEHKVVLDAQGLPSGIYFYQLRAEAFVAQRKMTLLR